MLGQRSQQDSTQVFPPQRRYRRQPSFPTRNIRLLEFSTENYPLRHDIDVEYLSQNSIEAAADLGV